MSVSKSRIQLVRSLEKKKFRDKTGLFISEGPKLTLELLEHFECAYLAAREEFLEEYRPEIAGEIQQVSQQELTSISLLKNPQSVLALFKKPSYSIDKEYIKSHLTLALDGVQDPGNLGTILRLADWFGVKDVLCSKETADVFNPKCVQATMGAIARVRVHYLDLYPLLEELSHQVPVFTTELEGCDIYQEPLSQNGIIVMGNEGNGVSAQIRSLSSRKLLIPSYPKDAPTSESLNVGIATAVVLSEFRRRML